MAIPPIAALEIGTSRTVVCVGESDNGGRVKITGVGIYSPTIGVRKGQVVDLSQASAGVDVAVKQAEKQANVELWQVLLAISGSHIQAAPHSGMVHIRSGGDSVVTPESIEEVSRNAEDSVHLEPEREILHTVQQSYTVDDQPGIFKPEGMRCRTLTKNVMAIHGQKSRIENAVSVAKSVTLEVEDVAYSGVCAALAALTPEQKHEGVVLIDLGGGTTNYVAYNNDVISAAGCIAVGGDHVTNDIALAFNISLKQAEDIKLKDGCAVIDAESSVGRVTLTADVGFEERALSRKALHTVINARLDETFRVVRSKLDEAGVLSHMSRGIVLTGGGAYLEKVTDLARRVFGLPCSIGVPVNVDGLELAEQPAALATAAGLVLYGRMAYESRKAGSVISIFKRVFGK